MTYCFNNRGCCVRVHEIAYITLPSVLLNYMIGNIQLLQSVDPTNRKVHFWSFRANLD